MADEANPEEKRALQALVRALFRSRNCTNPLMEYEEFIPAHPKAPDICKNCPKWEKRP